MVLKATATNANIAAEAEGSVIALHERCSGELKMPNYLKLNFLIMLKWMTKIQALP